MVDPGGIEPPSNMPSLQRNYNNLFIYSAPSWQLLSLHATTRVYTQVPILATPINHIYHGISNIWMSPPIQLMRSFGQPIPPTKAARLPTASQVTLISRYLCRVPPTDLAVQARTASALWIIPEPEHKVRHN